MATTISIELAEQIERWSRSRAWSTAFHVNMFPSQIKVYVAEFAGTGNIVYGLTRPPRLNSSHILA